MIRLSVSASRKVPGHQDFSSDGYHAELSIELPDSLLGDVDTVRQKLAGLFREARSAVDAQVEGGHVAADPNVDLRNRIEHAVNGNGNGSNGSNGQNGASNGNGSTATSQQPATGKQLGFIRSLAKRQQIDRQQLDQLVTQLTGCKGLGDSLSKVDASLVIEELVS